MNKILDKHVMQTSLDRAAWLALHGAPDDKRGQSGGGIADTAMRLRNELRIVTANWATVEAFNRTLESFREGLIAADVWQPAKCTSRALVRDVIMALMRMTEGPGPEGELQTLSSILSAFDGKTLSEIAEATAASETDIRAGLEFLRAHVPLRWGKNEPLPINRELAEFRDTFKPVRDRLIAHAMVHSSIDLRRDMKKLRDFLLLVSSLSDAACMICNVPRDNPQDRWNAAYAEATRFWEIVAVGAEGAARK